MPHLALVVGLLTWAAPAPVGQLGEFFPPVPLLANGKPIDVERDGHAAPFVGDFDGDGIVDVLVGQYDEGRLRVYRNIGTNRAPKFGAYTWFQAGGALGRVPEG